jgi:hypothetical protein
MMYGVRAGSPASQAYYDSIFAQWAEWGVDFVKMDDMSSPYFAAEVEMVAKALQKSGRPMVLSLSPGDEIHARGGLGLRQAKHSHIRQLPRHGLNRHRRPRHNEIRGGRAEPAVSVKDEDIRRIGHNYSLPRETLDFASRQTVQHLTSPHP